MSDRFQFLKESAPVPRIFIGTAWMGSVLRTAPSQSLSRFLDEVLEMGCNAFDTASSYRVGGTEVALGHWIHARKCRDKLFLVSKAGHPYPLLMPNRLTPGAIQADLENSLRRLHTDRLDLFLLHKDHPNAKLDEILETLSKLKKAGKFVAWGVSNWSASRIQRLMDRAKVIGLAPPSANSPQFSLLEWDRQPYPQSIRLSGNEDLQVFHRKTQMPVLAWSPLGGGSSFTPGGLKSPWKTAQNEKRVEMAIQLADKYSVEPSQIALAYLFHQNYPVYAITGSTSPKRIQGNLAATQLRLTDEDLKLFALPDLAKR